MHPIFLCALGVGFMVVFDESADVMDTDGALHLLSAIINRIRKDYKNGDPDAAQGFREWIYVLIGDNITLEAAINFLERRTPLKAV